MLILTISSLYPPLVVGGAEIAAKALVDGLHAKGHEVHVLTLVPKKNQESIQKINGVTIHHVFLDNIYWPYNTGLDESQIASSHGGIQKLHWHIKDTANQAMAKVVMKKIQHIAPDVVMTHALQGFSTLIWKTIKEQKIAILHTLHDFALMCVRTTFFKNGKNCKTQSGRCADCKIITHFRMKHTRFIDGVVAVSAAVLKVHNDHGLFLTTPSTVIHNSMANGIQPVDAETVRWLSKDSKLVLGFLSRVDESKGFHVLLKAIENIPNVKLIVAGKYQDKYLEKIKKEYPKSFDAIEFLGFCIPNDFFAKIDVLVFPSVQMEALGNVVFEAYFQGIPVVASNQGGIPEMISDGETGFLFEKGDSTGLKEIILRLMESPKSLNRLKENVLKKSIDFMPKNRIDNYEKALLDAIKNNK